MSFLRPGVIKQHKPTNQPFCYSIFLILIPLFMFSYPSLCSWHTFVFLLFIILILILLFMFPYLSLCAWYTIDSLVSLLPKVTFITFETLRTLCALKALWTSFTWNNFDYLMIAVIVKTVLKVKVNVQL